MLYAIDCYNLFLGSFFFALVSIELLSAKTGFRQLNTSKTFVKCSKNFPFSLLKLSR